ncbi:MAG: adenylosuccinate synthetase, partial [Gemmatimonadaceae bacterium]
TQLGQLEPVYEWIDGWQSPTNEARTMADLPTAARAYLERIEELVETPIRYVSVGTRRDQIIDATLGAGALAR